MNYKKIYEELIDFRKNLPGWCNGSTRKNEICEDFKQQHILHVKDERIVRFYHPAPSLRRKVKLTR